MIKGDSECRRYSWPIGVSVAQAEWLGPKVSSCLVLVLHLSNAPGELLQWMCHDGCIVSYQDSGHRLTAS